MKKILVKIITILWLSLICFWNIYAAKWGNTYLEQIQDTKRDLNVWANENELLLNIAISIINILFIISIVYFFIIAIKLIANPDADQESGNFKKWIPRNAWRYKQKWQITKNMVNYKAGF